MTYILTADIGGTSCKLGIFDQQLEIINKWRVPTGVKNQTDILESIVESFQNELDKMESDFEDCIGIGVGVPGPVNFKEGIVNGAVNLGWKGQVNVRKKLNDMTKLEVVVENDANLAALGEQFKGAGKNYSNVAVLTIGTGVGGGIISNRQLMLGYRGASGEVGHLKVDHTERFRCNCGHRGCLETVASATGIVNLCYDFAQEFPDTKLSELIDSGDLTSKDVIQAAQDKDPLALKVLNKVGYYIALGLSYIASVVNPSHFVIGGGVSDAGHVLLDSIISQFPTVTFPPAAEGVHIVLAQLGNDAGIYGAARLVEQHIK